MEGCPEHCVRAQVKHSDWHSVGAGKMPREQRGAGKAQNFWSDWFGWGPV